jgi:phosphatidylglycerol:prolipoprotein diacylglycerol transferase
MNVLAALPYWKFGPWTLVEELPLINAPLQVHSFGMLVAIGLIATLTVASWRGEKKMGISGERVQNFGIFLIIFGWIFSHVFNVVFYEPEKLAENPAIIFEVWGSISSYGGLLGGIIAVFIWNKTHEDLDLLEWADIAAFSLPVGWFFGRMGCASVHDHPGAIAPESWPLAFAFPEYNRIGEVVGNVPRHDLGFYEMLWWAVIVAAVFWLARNPRPKGFFLGVVFMLYAPVRFVLDFMRVWPASDAGTIDVNPFVGFFLDLLHVQPEVYTYGGDARYLGLTPAQYVSIGIFTAGVLIYLKIKDNPPIEWKQFERKPRPDKSSK